MIVPSQAVEPELTCDIAVIGGGIAGLIIATRLASAGKTVVVLESGGREQKEESHPLNAVELAGDFNKGASEGRFRCLGGTSTRWGGALIPFLAEDFSVHPSGWNADWLGLGPELLAYLDEAERLFGLPTGPYEDDIAPLHCDGIEFVPRSAKWPPFAKRNVAKLLERELDAPAAPRVLLDATVTHFDFAADGRLAAVRTTGVTGHQVKVRAGEFVIAAGAIESTRLLLLADRASGERAFAPHDVLGRYFHDHLGAAPYRLETQRQSALNRLTGFRFDRGAMRNLRFELAPKSRKAQQLPASFAHISFVTGGSSGFDLLRDIMRHAQRRSLPPPGLVARLGLSLPWLTRALWWRLVHERLLYPGDADIRFNIVLEQKPERASRITLSQRPDPLGQPMARIDWRISSEDVDNMDRTAGLLRQGWNASAHARLATLVPVPGDAITNSGGVYHPGGSTRVGASPDSGVLDRDLRCHSIPNVSVASTSAFPSGGGANPTMMLVMAALRLADRLSKRA